MKNVLFATSALVALGGAAWADAHAGISLTGSARLGLIYEEDAVVDGQDQEVRGTSRVRLGATASGTSDSGLTFGASARFDHDADNRGGFGDNAVDDGGISTDGSVFVSGAFGTLSAQDVDDAVENRVAHVGGVGLTGLGDRNEITRSAVPGSIIRYDYDFGSFGVSVSANGALEEFQVGAGYSGDFGGTGIAVGIGYDDTVEDGHVAASIGVTFGDISVKVAASDNDAFTDAAVSVGYTAGALGITAFYSDRESQGAGLEEAYGLGASYDLGGGLSLVGGVVDGDAGMAADFGLNMSF